MTFFESFTYVCIRTEVGGSRMSVAVAVASRVVGRYVLGKGTYSRIRKVYAL